MNKVYDSIKSLDDPNITTLELHTTLNTLHAQLPLSNSNGLLLCNVFERILGKTFQFMDDDLKSVVFSMLANPIGINQLIRIIKDHKQEQKHIYIDIFINVINQKLQLLLEIEHLNTVELLQLRSLILIKIPECLGFLLVYSLENPNQDFLDRDLVKRTMDNFNSILLNSLINLDFKSFERNQFLREILSSILLQDADKITFFLNNWNSFFTIFSSKTDSKTSKQSHQFNELKTKLLLGIFKAMNEKIRQFHFQSYHCWKVIISRLLQELEFDNNTEILGFCENNSNEIVSAIWISEIDHHDIKIELLDSLIFKFGKVDYVMNTNRNEQINLVKFLFLLFQSITLEKLQSISNNPSFLNTITARLESKSSFSRELGMYVADFVYFRLNKSFMFSVSGYVDKRDEFFRPFKLFNEQFNNAYDFETAIEYVLENDTALEVPSEPTETIESQPVMIDIDYNSDNEDSDLEDATVSRRPTVSKPVFLKDLLHYLTTDKEKDNTSYDKKSIAFSIGIEMIRIKKDTPELKFYCKKLIDAGLNLDDYGFPIKKNLEISEDDTKVAFDSWRLSFLISLCACEPDISIDYLLHDFIKQDWSTPTRIQVLSCIGLSCRELSGKEDSFVWGKTNLDKVKPKLLNGPGHSEFLKLDSRRKVIDVDVEKSEKKLLKALENCDINEGTTVRRSRKLEIDKKNEDLNKFKSINTTFINKKLPKIYFSLVALWQEINVHTYNTGFNIGSLSEYLNSHYIDIMSMIYSCGVPSCIELIEMSLELISTLIGQLRSIQTRADSHFPTLLFKSIVNSIKLLLADNDRTIAILKANNSMELTMLFEIYTLVLADTPPLENETRVLGMLVLEQLQSLSIHNFA